MHVKELVKVFEGDFVNIQSDANITGVWDCKYCGMKKFLPKDILKMKVLKFSYNKEDLLVYIEEKSRWKVFHYEVQ